MAALVRRQGPVARALTQDYWFDGAGPRPGAEGPAARASRLRSHFFARLVRAIVGQQISGKAAAAIYRRLAARAGATGIPSTPSAPGAPGTPLAPEALAALADDDLRACGLSQNKLLSLRDLAARALDGRLDLAHLETLPDAAVTAQLVAVRGIGRWTADMFLMFALGRPDVLPAEDLGIQNAVERLYGLDTHPKPATIRRLAEAGGWHPFTTAACFHLWDSLE